MQPDIQITAQSTGALEQHKVLRNTYLLLSLTMVPTVIGALIGVNTNFSFLATSPIIGSLIMLAVMMGLLYGVTLTRNSGWGIGLLFAFTFVAGWFLGPILQHALHLRNGAQLIGMSAGFTAVIFFGLAGLATYTKKDFSFLGKFLFIGLILVFVAALANIFLQVPALALTISTIAVLLFSLYILYDVSRIINGGETNYIMATMALYLDIYNVFTHLLHLLMAFTGERD